MPYLWGTVGLGVNKEKVRAIRPDAPLNSLNEAELVPSIDVLARLNASLR